jgi:hypothetical protein
MEKLPHYNFSWTVSLQNFGEAMDLSQDRLILELELLLHVTKSQKEDQTTGSVVLADSSQLLNCLKKSKVSLYQASKYSKWMFPGYAHRLFL